MPAPVKPRGQAGDQDEYSFVPDFAWAVVGGLAMAAACALVYTLAVTWGGLRVGPAIAGGEAASITAYYSELAGFFLAGFLMVFIARGVTARTP